MAQVGLLEDNARIAKLCATMLQFAGHQVTVYEHPRQCLHALLPEATSFGGIQSKSAQPNPLPVDVLILDLYLPDISGLEVLRRLQSYPSTQNLPLVLCTAAPGPDVTRALSIVPHASFVEKPFKLEALTSAITNALKSTPATN
jgi:CheY-like chemotaxis protein